MIYDEDEVKEFALDCVALVAQDAGRVGVNCARMQHDAELMGYERSRFKHLNELRVEQGLDPIPSPFPPIPSRAEVLSVNMHFRGGIIINSPIYGKMPWYPAALSWCDVATRILVYDAMRVAGDTHAIIQVPNGLPLYDEQGQFYSPDKFPALDWTNGETQITTQLGELVDEVIKQGFKFIINMDERFDHSIKIVQLVMRALTDQQLAYGFIMPGYDGVFYGWQPIQVTNWASAARSIKPNCYLGIEHNVGHIPVGNGSVDYSPNGAMAGYDVILGEFADNLHQDSTWQILGRMIRPYNRPNDQKDDPNPPFYLMDSLRGARFYCAFETDNPYEWVRVDINNPTAIQNQLNKIESERAYFKSLGCRFIG